jgi:Kinesin motor domain
MYIRIWPDCKWQNVQYDNLTPAMEGPKNADAKDRGVILRVAEQIVQHIQERRSDPKNMVEFTVTGSYLEIYQENLRDLLSDEDTEMLKIRMDPLSNSGKELYVEGLSERLLSTEADFARMIALGTSRRTVADTNMNEVSSRSHAVLTLTVKQYQRVKTIKAAETDVGGMKRSKIHLIDLAGSERADSTGATGQRLKEGSAINQSLSSLGNVINALSTNAAYVPYRDSKLTYLLSDSLGGNSLTLVLACLTPIAAAYDETIGTLRFAERAKKVQNRARVNVDPNLLRFCNLTTGYWPWKLKLLVSMTCYSPAIVETRNHTAPYVSVV